MQAQVLVDALQNPHPVVVDAVADQLAERRGHGGQDQHAKDHLVLLRLGERLDLHPLGGIQEQQRGGEGRHGLVEDDVVVHQPEVDGGEEDADADGENGERDVGEAVPEHGLEIGPDADQNSDHVEKVDAGRIDLPQSLGLDADSLNGTPDERAQPHVALSLRPETSLAHVSHVPVPRPSHHSRIGRRLQPECQPRDRRDANAAKGRSRPSAAATIVVNRRPTRFVGATSAMWPGRLRRRKALAA